MGTLDIGLSVGTGTDEDATPVVNLAVKMPDDGVAMLSVASAVEIGLDIMQASWQSVFVRSLIMFLGREMEMPEEEIDKFVALLLVFHKKNSTGLYQSVANNKAPA